MNNNLVLEMLKAPIPLWLCVPRPLAGFIEKIRFLFKTLSLVKYSLDGGTLELTLPENIVIIGTNKVAVDNNIKFEIRGTASINATAIFLNTENTANYEIPMTNIHKR